MLYLKIHPDSQFAELLKRLIVNPTIRTQEVISSWQHKARGGGTTDISGTRAAFLLDLIGEAVTGSWIDKATKGVITIDVKDALLADAPVNATTVTVSPAPADDSMVKALEKRIQELEKELKAASGVTTKVTPQTAPAVKAEPLVTPTIFPSVPVNRASLGAKFIAPSWYSIMCDALTSGRHVSIAGPPGPGKSTAPEEYFIDKGQPYIIVNGDGGLRRRDLEGTKEIGGGSSFFQVAEFAAAAIMGWGAILNEVNAAEPDALLLINGIIETPRCVTVNGRTYPVHKDFRLVVTYNPGLAGTKPLPPAFKDRFFPIKLGFVSKSFLKKMLVVHGMPDNAPYSDLLIDFAQELWKTQESGSMRYQISPRRLFDAVFLIEKVKRSPKQAVQQAVVDAIDSHSDCAVINAIIDKMF